MSEVQARASTPRHFWVVGILALLWDAMGAFDFLMTQTRNPAYMGQFTPEQLDYYYGFPAWAVVTWAIAVWGGLLGCVLLLLRRRLATPVFLISLIGLLLTALYNYGLSEGPAVSGGPGAVVFSVVIVLVAVGLLLYSRAMGKRGVLR